MDEFENKYEKGARIIKFSTSQLKIVKPSLELKIEKGYGNYKMFYSREGRCLHSWHNENKRDGNFQILYTYNYQNQITCAIKTISLKNTLSEISECLYDQEGRIDTEICRSIYGSGWEVIKKAIHTYSDNKEEVFLPIDEESDNSYNYYLTYDEKGREIETKIIINGNEIHTWTQSEYDKAGNAAREISLDENGKQDGIYEFLYCDKGLQRGYKYSSEDLNYSKENIYTFNERGHWVSQVLLREGEPQFFYDREIEYYD